MKTYNLSSTDKDEKPTVEGSFKQQEKEIKPVDVDKSEQIPTDKEKAALYSIDHPQVIGIDNAGYAKSCQKVSPPPSYKESAVEIDEDEEEVDPWTLVAPPDTGKPWDEMTVCEKLGRVAIAVIKVLTVLVLLYLFICSIDLLGSSFELIGGRTAGEAFKSDILQNPICGLCIGIAITVLLQSSSTSTSIVVTMVAANILTVQQGIYIIMGANIGTSITSSIVALTQVADKNTFRRAFASSMLLYTFNLITCVILLPLEYFTGYLYEITKLCVSGINVDSGNTDDGPKFLKVITQPLIKLIIEVDGSVMGAVAEDTFYQKRPLTKYICDNDPEENIYEYKDYDQGTVVEDQPLYISVKENKSHPLLWATNERIETVYNVTLAENMDDGFSDEGNVTRFSWQTPNFDSEKTKQCSHIFTGAGLPSEYEVADGWPNINLSDGAVGTILLVLSLVVLCGCLIGMVKVLSSLLKGSVLKTVRKSINADFPCGRLGKELAGYVAIAAGIILTILVQSSSVFTSALNPLAGMGIVGIERVYPLTVGADIGTCVTAILAGFTNDPDQIQNALQCAFAHFFFNITGFLILYPIPKMRQLPIYLSMKLGDITAEYKWFAIVVLLMTYVILPLVVLFISLPGWYVLAAVALPIIIFISIIVTINCMQTRCPTKLHPKCQSWSWCPIWFHSLEPYDKCLRSLCPCKSCHENDEASKPTTEGSENQEDIVMTVMAGDLVPTNEDSDSISKTPPSSTSGSLFESDGPATDAL